ncbi:hypothetical protein P280DRAFT_194764 [Massarina eburnea CBS 473.64]|uniref:Uncharacterized protein n=1 Tax=Massarina eburnea CBS 473.64 TaxID=1395130 RepID=A0A6A6RJN5_9PLEO|nr:hypothetical protein P280DRAFT_194764 [Massarina eburnea CBS 473.64]
MMSYFELPTRTTKPTAPIGDGKHNAGFGTPGLLTPQVTSILEGLDWVDESSSEDEGDSDHDHDADHNGQTSLSGYSSASDKDTRDERKSSLRVSQTPPSSSSSGGSLLRKAATSSLPRSGQNVEHPPSPAPVAAPLRPGHGQKHPHLARFQSLRSMLFNSHIEENMKEQKEKEEAERKWKMDSEGRKGKKMPEKEKGTKEGEKERGTLRRMGTRLKRLGSNAPSMGTVTEGEVADNVSPASEEDRRASDDVDHSDGESRVNKSQPTTTNDNSEDSSDHDSLGHSDVEDLLRWIGRKEAPNMIPSPPASTEPQQSIKPTPLDDPGYSSVSTESDSESDTAPKRRVGTMTEGDVDDLVRWISRKEGPAAGPIMPSKTPQHLDSGTGLSSPSSHSISSSSDDEDTAELMRWVTRKDDPSGESDGLGEDTAAGVERGRTGSRLRDEVPRPDGALLGTDAKESNAGLTPDDVDHLVKWVGKKNDGVAEAGRKDVEVVQ